MTDSQFIQFCTNTLNTFREKVPIRTGNLRYNAVRGEFIDSTTFAIYVDESIAPYFVYTEYVWISPRWHGKKNPNEGWFEKACLYAIYKASANYGYNIRRL